MAIQFDAAGQATHYFFYGPAVDQIFADENASGDVLWPLTDHQGSVRDLANYDAQTDYTSVTGHRTYSGFGVSTQASDFLFGYAGREVESATGLSYNRARFYDSRAGRFLSEDPKGFAAGDANLYRYVGNEPTGKTDPSGMDELRIPRWGNGPVMWTTESDRIFFFEPNYDTFEIGVLTADGNNIVLPNGVEVSVTAARDFANGVNTARGTTSTMRRGRPIADVHRDEVIRNLTRLSGASGKTTVGGAAGFVAGVGAELCDTARDSLAAASHPIDTVVATARFFGRPYDEVERDFTRGIFESLDEKLDTSEGIGRLATAWALTFATPETLLDDVSRLRYLESVGAARKSIDAAAELAAEIRKLPDGPERAQKLDELMALAKSAVAPNALTPRNAHLAGKTHPVTGVPFDAHGYPNFSGVATRTVEITQIGNRAVDFAAANRAAGLAETPKGFTWHHNQNGTTMQLVPTPIHRATGHTGGVALGGGGG